MNALTSTTDKIVAVLAGAITTNQVRIVASWHDITNVPTYDAGSSGVLTNNTTQVDIVAAPAADIQRVIDAINIHNSDTVAVTITISYSDNGTLYTLWKFSLDAGSFATYTRGSGLKIRGDDGVEI